MPLMLRKQQQKKDIETMCKCTKKTKKTNNFRINSNKQTTTCHEDDVKWNRDKGVNNNKWQHHHQQQQQQDISAWNKNPSMNRKPTKKCLLPPLPLSLSPR